MRGTGKRALSFTLACPRDSWIKLFLSCVSVVWDLCRDHGHTVHMHSRYEHLRSHATLLVTTKPLEFKINYPVTTVRTEAANWQGAKAETPVHTARLKKPLYTLQGLKKAFIAHRKQANTDTCTHRFPSEKVRSNESNHFKCPNCPTPHDAIKSISIFIQINVTIFL